MELTSLTIVLPAFNEEPIIAEAINSAKKAAERITQDFEIIIVDDGSRDRTPDIIKEVASFEPRIRGISFPSQMGYGKAIAAGIYNAKKEFVFYTDSDAPIDISKELTQAAGRISESVDAVIGYRINRQDIPLRRLYSIIYNFMCRILLGIKVRDVNFSCKLFRRKIFDRFRLYSSSVFIDAEILARLNLHKFKLEEFPATYISRKHGCSNFDSPLYAMGIFVEILIFWMKHCLLGQRPKGTPHV